VIQVKSHARIRGSHVLKLVGPCSIGILVIHRILDDNRVSASSLS
jgi:hypothetical protein